MEDNKNTTVLSKHCWFLLTSSIGELLPSDKRQGLVPQRSQFLAHRQHRWQNPVQTVQPRVAQGCRDWGGHLLTITSPCCQGRSGSKPKAVPAAPARLVLGAGCLGWREDKGGDRRAKQQSRTGTVFKRLRDHATSSLSGCHCNGLGSSTLLLLGFDFYFFLPFKSLISQTSWSFLCNLGFIHMHAHTQAQVWPASLLLHGSLMRTA